MPYKRLTIIIPHTNMAKQKKYIDVLALDAYARLVNNECVDIIFELRTILPDYPQVTSV